MNAPLTASRAFTPEAMGEHAYLALLAKVKMALTSAKDVVVPAIDIRPYPDQPRKHFNAESLKRLSESIDAGGQTTPGLIRYKVADTPYELIDGERRWRAVMQIPEQRRPPYKAQLIEADDFVVQYLISGIANFNREGHTVPEMIDTIVRLVGFDFPMEKIAQLLGIGKQWADSIYSLRNLDPTVKQLLDPALPRQEQLPVTAAIEIAKIDPKYQLDLAARVVRKDVSMDGLRSEVVKTAKLAGAPIREREISPHKKWVSFGTKVDGIFREAESAERLLRSKVIDPYYKARSNEDETARLVRRLRDTQKSIDASLAILQTALPKEPR